MSARPSGSRGALISKCLLIGSITASILEHHLSYSLAQTKVMKVVECLAFKNIKDLTFAGFLMYNFRELERRRGSGRYGAFCMILLLSDFVTRFILRRYFYSSPAIGPYALVIANLVTYIWDVPALHFFKFFGIRLNEKVTVYMASCPIIFTALKSSLPSFLLGLIFGLLHHFKMFGLHKLCNGRGVTTNVSPEALSQLVAMGFSEEVARQALLLSQNDVQRAIGQLLQ